MCNRRLNISINDDLFSKLKKLATDRGLSMSAYLRLLVAQQWDEQKK